MGKNTNSLREKLAKLAKPQREQLAAAVLAAEATPVQGIAPPGYMPPLVKPGASAWL